MNRIKIIEHYISLLAISFFVIVFLVYTWILNENILDPGDGVKHFLIAKYSWLHSDLFFDHWGKPLFTILSSTFVQAGFKGMIFFNICLFVITSVFLLKITKILSLNCRVIAIVLCFISPVFFRDILSGLTEILFATIVVATLYFFLKRNFLIGCIILSFSFFSRPESSLIIPFYVLYLIIEKEYKYIPFLATGIIVYSVAGYSTYNDVFWVFTNRPYSSLGTYGSGKLFHFIFSFNKIFGFVVTFLFVIGSGIITYGLMKNIRKKRNIYLTYSLLILAPVFSVVFTHSIMWWKGLQGSAGLLRVLATIVPLVALVCLLSLNQIINRVCSNKAPAIKITNVLLFIFFSGLSIRASVSFQLDERMMASEKTLLKAAEWYKKNNKGDKIYYMPPYFAYQAGIDPFGENSNMEKMKRFKDKKIPSSNMKDGELLLWEGQFSELEGRLPLYNLLNDDKLVLLKSFNPLNEITFYGKKYEVHLFKKDNSLKLTYNKEIKGVIERIKRDSIWLKGVKDQAKERNISLDEMLLISAKFVIRNRNK